MKNKELREEVLAAGGQLKFNRLIIKHQPAKMSISSLKIILFVGSVARVMKKVPLWRT
jgi:hypothetical protein